jgi:hypothetical protein
MLKTLFPCATLDFNSNVYSKTWHLTTHHQTYHTQGKSRYSIFGFYTHP